MTEQKNPEKVTIEMESFEELKEFIETMTDSTLVSIELKLVLSKE